MTRRSFVQSIAGGVFGILASAWCPAVLRAGKSVRFEPGQPVTRLWCPAETLSFRDADNWRPRGVPARGDTLIFDSGEAGARRVFEAGALCDFGFLRSGPRHRHRVSEWETSNECGF